MNVESTPVAAPPLPSRLLRNRNFLLLWGAYAVSAFGDHLSEMAILKTQDALHGEHATALMARLTFLFFLPFVVLGPITGLLADRLPRRAIMITADLARFVIMLAFPLLMAWTSPLGPWGPFLPVLAIGTFAAAFSPARFALLPTLIRPGQLVQANGLLSGVGIMASMIAYVLGGYLAERHHILVAFRLDAGTYLASAVLLTLLALPRRQPADASTASTDSSLHALIEGFRYARRHRRVVELIAVASVVWFCGALLTSALPAVVRDAYHGGYEDVGTYRACFGAGFLLGSALVASLGRALRSEIALTWGLFGAAGGMGLFTVSALVPMPAGAAAVGGGVGIVLVGVFGVAVMASYNSLLQRTVADRCRGRVFGVVDVVTLSATLVATGTLAIPNWQTIDRWVGFIVLGATLLPLGAGIWGLRVRLRRSDLGSALAAAVHANEFLSKFWYRLERVGRPTVPRFGPVIVAANHRCAADPLLLCAALPYRPPAFLTAREYANVPIARWFMRLVGCIPVRRDGTDTAATKQALRHLRAGGALAVFIEGRIVTPGEEVEPRDGVAMLALRTGAPVIPAYIGGTIAHDSAFWGLVLRHHARVRFGPAVDLSDLEGDKASREAVRTATRRIYAAIQGLAEATQSSVRMDGE
ncbi:MAG TPA: MFS transporter [Phycisphaerae bacterium]|nr:MFS transporter [Phycisphaerae bacterium]HNU47146.1 MFS transporter [Phycisphaerae bacterium]